MRYTLQFNGRKVHCWLRINVCIVDTDWFDDTCLDTENINNCQIVFDGSFFPIFLLTICEHSECGGIQKICVGHDSGCGIVWLTKINGTVTS